MERIVGVIKGITTLVANMEMRSQANREND